MTCLCPSTIILFATQARGEYGIARYSPWVVPSLVTFSFDTIDPEKKRKINEITFNIKHLFRALRSIRTGETRG